MFRCFFNYRYGVICVHLLLKHYVIHLYTNAIHLKERLSQHTTMFLVSLGSPQPISRAVPVHYFRNCS